jgi:hypothetical protein
MATTVQVRWGKRARWSFCVGVVFAVFGACTSSTIDNSASDGAGKGGGGSGAVGGKGHLPIAGTTSTLPNAGEAGALSNGGTGGVDNDHPRHSDANAGYAGCSFDDECGGCEAGHHVVKCGWGEIDLQYEDERLEPEEWQRACTVAQAQAAGGASGAANADPAAAGASSYPGTCHSYRPRNTVIRCDDQCAETLHEDKQGECAIRDECCIVLWRVGCST